MKFSISIFFFLLGTLGLFAQKRAEGLYKGGIAELMLRNSHYYYKAYSHLGTTIDSGMYEMHGDTILFHSLLKKEDIESNFEFNTNAVENPGLFMDTCYFSITNASHIPVIYHIDVKLNNDSLLHIDSLPKDVRRNYFLPVKRQSDNNWVRVKIKEKQLEIPLDFIIRIDINSSRQQLSPIEDKMIYEKDKVYSLNLFHVFKKKVYLYR